MPGSANSGRRSAPRALKLLEGRAEGRDSGGREVPATPGFVRLAPEPPTWLGDHARAMWELVVPELQRLQLVKPIDAASLSAYCEMWELFVTATDEVHRSGLVVKNRSVKKDGTESVWYTQNPAVGIQTKAQAAIRGWAQEFGLSPAAESRVSPPVVSSVYVPGNPFA